MMAVNNWRLPVVRDEREWGFTRQETYLASDPSVTCGQERVVLVHHYPKAVATSRTISVQHLHLHLHCTCAPMCSRAVANGQVLQFAMLHFSPGLAPPSVY